MARSFGYARPSVDAPDPKTHADLLTEAGAEHLFVEATIARAPRSLNARRRLLRELTPEDTLIVPSLDRLGFSMDDVLRALCDLVAEGVNVRILDAEIETNGPCWDAYKSLLCILKTTSSALHSEEAKVRIAAARARGGKPAGVKPTLTPEMWPEIRKRLKTTKIKDLAQELGVARQTLWNYRKRCQDLGRSEDDHGSAQPSEGPASPVAAGSARA